MRAGKNSRRRFLNQSAVLSAASIFSPGELLNAAATQTGYIQPATGANKLPRWKGFNLLDFFSPDPANSRRPTTEDHLRWMHDWGFDFVRIPIAYPYYLDFDRTRNITREEVYRIDEKETDKIKKLVALA